MDEDRRESVESEVESDDTQDVSACKTGSPSTEDDEPAWVREKKLEIVAALKADPVNISLLREMAVTNGGFLCNSLRRRVWPKLLGVNPHRLKKYAGPLLSSHKDRAQVILDVNRCGRRIPDGISVEEQGLIQNRMENVILRLLMTHPKLCYYQGLHDVTLTFLLVLQEEDMTFAVMDTLVQYHLRDFLDLDMGKTKEIIAYISPLLSLVDSELEQFITASECAYYFSLSWLITWYGHVAHTSEQTNRLTDFFLASHPLMPVYMAATIILSRRDEILQQECEISSVHGLLCKLPETLDYDQMILDASRLFNQHPVKSVAHQGRINLNSSHVNQTHSKFLRLTKNLRPDHILATLPEEQPSWFPWDSLPVSPSFLLTTFVVSSPVLVAVVLYFLQRYWRTSQQSITS